MNTSNDIDRYICSHIDAEHPYLHQLSRDSQLYLVHGHMVSGHLQGTLLRMIVSMVKPRLILETGTYTGYSAMSMAMALEEGSTVLTYEINDEMEDFTRPRIKASPWADKIDFRIGDVMTDLPEDILQGQRPIDMIFLDGNKRQYADYYHKLFPLLRRGGLMIADNTLWDGHVVDAAYDHDAQTLGIRQFNDMVASDEHAEKVILPLRDGLTLIRKKS